MKCLWSMFYVGIFVTLRVLGRQNTQSAVWGLNMLAKTLRAFERSLGGDISERELTCEDITSLINVARVYVMNNSDTLRISSFCTMVNDICIALRDGHFETSSSRARNYSQTSTES